MIKIKAFTPLEKIHTVRESSLTGPVRNISYKKNIISNGAGFTFIELLLVIIIIGILTGVSIPQLRKAFDNFALENFAKDIYYLSRYLQGSAIAGGKIYYLNINKDKGEFQATYKEENEFKNIQGRFGKIYKALDGIIVSLDPSERTGVYFYPDGSMDKIRITLENQYKKQLSIITKGVAGEIQIQ